MTLRGDGWRGQGGYRGAFGRLLLEELLRFAVVQRSTAGLQGHGVCTHAGVQSASRWLDLFKVIPVKLLIGQETHTLHNANLLLGVASVHSTLENETGLVWVWVTASTVYQQFHGKIHPQVPSITKHFLGVSLCWNAFYFQHPHLQWATKVWQMACLSFISLPFIEVKCCYTKSKFKLLKVDFPLRINQKTNAQHSKTRCHLQTQPMHSKLAPFSNTMLLLVFHFQIQVLQVQSYGPRTKNTRPGFPHRLKHQIQWLIELC